MMAVKFRVEPFVDRVIGGSDQASGYKADQNGQNEIWTDLRHEQQTDDQAGDHENVLEPMVGTGDRDHLRER